MRAIRDQRKWSAVSLWAIWRSLFLLFFLRLSSLHALEQMLKRMGSRVLGERPPSADTIGYALSRVDPDEARDVLYGVVKEARRRKALRGKPYLVLAIDGHEFFSSRKISCPQCSVREVKTGKGKVKEYYHRGVVCQLVGVTPPLVLDFEMQGPQEGEITAARRLLARVLRRFGRYVFAVTMDGLYADRSMLRMLIRRGIGAVVALKGNRKKLWQELELRSSYHGPKETVRRGRETIHYWEYEDRTFLGWRRPVRLIRVVREKPDGPMTDWRYIVAGPISWQTADEIGHLRWEEENRGFHELATHWHLDHCFHHEFKAMQNIIAVLFLAYALTRLFFERNVKEPTVRALTHLAQAVLLVQTLGEPLDEPLWPPA